MTLSRLFSSQNVLVSTDSDKVKSLVEAKGLTVPFKRPKRLSDDFTGTGEVATHALRWFEKKCWKSGLCVDCLPNCGVVDRR